MNARVRNLALAFTIGLVLLGSLQITAKSVSAENIGAVIDIFTQKQPFSGKGLNTSSDAFAPGEEVVIYALVTYNDFPVSSANVAFEVQGPANPLQNITIFNSAPTNDSGIATISFRIGSSNEINFGEWAAKGNVNIGDTVVRDFLFFRVGWIVEVVNIRTVNENYAEQMSFARESFIGVELAIRSIAMTQRNATLTISIYDSMNVLINSTEINYFAVPPNESLVSATYFLSIPKVSTPGTAKVDAGAFTAPLSLGGVPYSPKVTTFFSIVNSDITILHVQLHPDAVFQGETVQIDVNVKNNGDVTEDFGVSAFYNGSLIGTIPATSLQAGLNITFSFEWNTSLVPDGSYQISASAGPVLGEVAVSDNYFKNGIVRVKSLGHDIVVVGVSPSSTSVDIGQIVDVHVVVKNNGSFIESFNVTSFYNSSGIGTLFVENLSPDEQRELVFHWDTSNVKEGKYILNAHASPVLSENNVENNYFIDGEIEFKVPQRPLPLSIFLLGLFLLLLLLILILLIIWLYNRQKRRRKQNQTSAQSQFSRALPECFNP